MRFLTIALIALAASASADEPAVDEAALNEARRLYDAGKTAYKLEDYETAVKDFEASYRRYHSSALLYDLAQAYRGLAAKRLTAPEAGQKDIQSAIHFYRQYITDLPTAPMRKDAERHIVELLDLAEHYRRLQDARPARVETEATKPSLTPPTQGAVSQPPPSSGKRITGIVLSIAGAVVAIGGAAFMGYAASVHSNANSAPNEGDRADRLSTSSTEYGAGAVLLGVGAAAVVAGVVLLVLPPVGDRHASVWIAPSGAGLVAGGRF